MYSTQQIIEIITQKLQVWLETAIKMLPNLALAVLFLGLFYIIGKVLRRVTDRVLKKFSDNIAVNQMISQTVFVILFCIGIFAALEILELDKTVTSLLAGAGILGLAFGFAFQDIASNFMSGVLIAFRKPYKINEVIEIDGHLGTVKKINLRTTSIENFRGQEVILPNKNIFTSTLTNYCTTGARRLEVEVGVSYDDDLEKVEKIAREVLESVDNRISEKPVGFYFREFGDSSINFLAFIWVKYPGQPNYFETKHRIIIALKKAFDEHNITIPFPIRTLEVDVEKMQEVIQS